MNHQLTEMASAGVERYGNFLTILRGQSESVFRRGSTDENLREEAMRTAHDAARAFLGLEQAWLNEDSIEVARNAHSAALTDLGLSDTGLEDRFADFVLSSAAYVSRIIAAQAERDIMTMVQHIQATAMRIDLYVRSGRHSPATAAAQVMIEDNQMPAFRFIDRMGRKFKTSKHVRDIYRQHLLHVYNEVYMDVVATHGHDSVFVDHPNPDYKWFGEELAIVTGGPDEALPLYYDVKDEIFHPSSEATVTIRYQE
jgi:hypothetical protein